MIPVDQIIKEYRVTEKAANLSADHNQYTFEVSSLRTAPGGAGCIAVV